MGRWERGRERDREREGDRERGAERARDRGRLLQRPRELVTERDREERKMEGVMIRKQRLRSGKEMRDGEGGRVCSWKRRGGGGAEKMKDRDRKRKIHFETLQI